MRVWEGAIRRLRRRHRQAEALRGIGRWLLWAGPIVVAWILLGRFSAWDAWIAHFTPHAFVLLFSSLLVTMIVFAWRAGRSNVYYAKWIDLHNALDDRLASAVDFGALPERDAFQARCIEQLELELGAKKRTLTLPRTLPPRWGLAPVCLLALAAVAGATMRRWRPPVVVEKDARRRAKLPDALATQATKAASAIAEEARSSDDVALEKLTNDLSSVLRALDAGALDRERSLSELQAIERQAAALAGNVHTPSTSGGGPVAQLAQAMEGGTPAQVAGALKAAAEALSTDRLDDAQKTALGESIDSLAQLAARAGQSGAALSSSLTSASQKLAAGDSEGAARALADAEAAMPAIEKPLAAWAAAKRAERAALAVEQVLGAPAETPSDDPSREEAIGRARLALSGSSGAGASTADDRQSDPAPNDAPQAPLQLSGAWNGKVIRQLFDSSSSNLDEEAKKLLVEHEQVVEDRFRRDEIPADYRDAVRTYFAALHQRGNAWTPIKK